MPTTPDRFPGTREEEEVQITPSATNPSEDGGIKYVDGSFQLKDSSGVFNPRTGGAGITPSQHEALRQLIHYVEEGPTYGLLSGAHKEVIGSPFPTEVIWWEDATKQKKIVEQVVTRSGPGASNVAPTPVIWRMYAGDGVTVLATVTDDITYAGVFEASRTRTIA